MLIGSINLNAFWNFCNRSEDEEPEPEPEPAKPTKATETNQKPSTGKQPAKSASANDESGSESSSEEDDDESDESTESEAEDGRTDAEIKKEKAWERIMVCAAHFFLIFCFNVRLMNVAIPCDFE